MNKTELINAMAEEAGLTKNDARKAYDAFVNTITGAMGKGEKVALLGFGTFFVNERAARAGVNPFTHEAIQIAAKKTVKFKASKQLNA